LKKENPSQIIEVFSGRTSGEAVLDFSGKKFLAKLY